MKRRCNKRRLFSPVIIAAILLWSMAAYATDNLTTGSKGTTSSGNPTSHSVDANTQSLDVNVSAGSIYSNYTPTFAGTSSGPTSTNIATFATSTIVSNSTSTTSIYVTAMSSSTTNTATVVQFREGGGGTIRHQAAITSSINDFVQFLPPWKLPAGTSLVSTMTVTSNVYMNVQYYIAP